MKEKERALKSLDLDSLMQQLHKVEDPQFWRELIPDLSITESICQTNSKPYAPSQDILEQYKNQLREEGYFQTSPVINQNTLDKMIACVEKVRSAGFPVIFSFVYDIFYSVIMEFDSILSNILGPDYKTVPNFWLYYIETSDNDKGFEPHRDAEYENTIDQDEMPTLITLWIPLTDATPMNSCMYLVPANRDPSYIKNVCNPKVTGTEFKLQDVRAIPAAAGTLSCWNQYICHWGSRSSKRAKQPRISYALYCQRGNVQPVDTLIDLRMGTNFQTRLALICRGIYRYSTMVFKDSNRYESLLPFFNEYMSILSMK